MLILPQITGSISLTVSAALLVLNSPPMRHRIFAFKEYQMIAMRRSFHNQLSSDACRLFASSMNWSQFSHDISWYSHLLCKLDSAKPSDVMERQQLRSRLINNTC